MFNKIKVVVFYILKRIPVETYLKFHCWITSSQSELSITKSHGD